MKNLVLPEPEPPTTSTFLLRAYLGSGGLPFMVIRSVWDKITLFENSLSIKGSISSCVPHLADPYSMLCLYFLAFLPFRYTANLSAPPTASPTNKSIGWRLGIGLEKAAPKAPPSTIPCNFSDMLVPSAIRHASPKFVATAPIST